MPLPKGTKEVALIGLLVADVALVYAVMRGSAAAPAAPESGPTAGATPTGGATGSATTAAPTVTSVAAMPISVVDNDVAWRAVPGTCAKGGASIAVTTDGGATWKAATSKMSAITRLTASSATSGFAVGATGTGCEMVVQNTEDGGASWIGGATGSTWRVELSDPTAVFTAAGRTVKPCGTNPVIGLQRTTDAAVTVLCGDGSIRSTSDGGGAWANTGTVSGALAIGVAGPVGSQRVVVAAKSADCPGLTIRSRTGGTSAQFSAPACVDVGTLAAGTSVGVGAATGDGARPWLLVGAKTWRGSPDLKSWQNVS